MHFHQRLFLQELQHQCVEAISAIQRLNKLTQSREATAVEIINTIDDFVDHAARAAVILWPVRNFRNTSAEVLRHLLEIPDDHALQNRALRHSLQHFDERLEKWVTDNPHGSVADHLVGPQNMVTGAAHFRRYDPGTKLYYFLSDEYDIQQHATAVDDVLTKARNLLNEAPRN